jgi:hypothetical protein
MIKNAQGADIRFALLSGGIVNDKTLKIPLGMSFRDIPHCRLSKLRGILANRIK